MVDATEIAEADVAYWMRKADHWEHLYQGLQVECMKAKGHAEMWKKLYEDLQELMRASKK
jgi:hypothetical protein